MSQRGIYDDQLYAHFVTFVCYKRRRLLDHDRAKKIVLSTLESQRRLQDAKCAGFVVMPDHVHAMLWFPEPNQLSHFMKQWKQRSSFSIKQFIREYLPAYADKIADDEPIWQRRYHPFHVYSDEKLQEKLDYMHMNPVRSQLVKQPIDWPWSSARWYDGGRSVGVTIEWPD